MNYLKTSIFVVFVVLEQCFGSSSEIFEVKDFQWDKKNNNFQSYHFRPHDNVKILEIRLSYGIKNLTSTFCYYFNQTQKFSAKGQSIEKIAWNAFKDCTKLTHLDLYNNKIQSVDSNLFNMNAKLQYVSFYSNLLKTIPGSLFEKNGMLKVLDLSNNQLESFSVHLMSTLKSVEELYVRENRFKKLNYELMFKKMPALKNLSVFHYRENVESLEEDAPQIDCHLYPNWILILSIIVGFVAISINTVIIYYFCKENTFLSNESQFR